MLLTLEQPTWPIESTPISLLTHQTWLGFCSYDFNLNPVGPHFQSTYISQLLYVSNFAWSFFIPALVFACVLIKLT
jgi:hypothetical protein